VQVAAKSNEIPALRTLLEVFDLVGAVITADAMHTQTTTAAYITGRGGHYVFTVKANQHALFARCKALPWADIRSTSACWGVRTFVVVACRVDAAQRPWSSGGA